MTKKHHSYEVSLTSKENRSDHVETEFASHDDVFHILNIVKEKGLFEEASDTTTFIIGLKMLTSIMLKHKNAELFEDLRPAIVNFMKKLKSR